MMLTEADVEELRAVEGLNPEHVRVIQAVLARHEDYRGLKEAVEATNRVLERILEAEEKRLAEEKARKAIEEQRLEEERTARDAEVQRAQEAARKAEEEAAESQKRLAKWGTIIGGASLLVIEVIRALARVLRGEP